MKNTNSSSNYIIFLIFGLGLIVLTFFIVKNNIYFLSNSQKVEGVVVRIIRSSSSDGTMYKPEVSFLDNKGEMITFSSNSSSSVSYYKEGQKISVLYNKNNSADAKINKFFELWGAGLISFFMGIIMAFVGFSDIFKIIKKSKLKKHLLINGTKIFAKVISVDDNLNSVSKSNSKFSYTSLNKKNYQITAQWLNPADNKMYVFKSDFINYNPSDIILNKDLGVYIDRTNPQKYYVDVSTLPVMGN